MMLTPYICSNDIFRLLKQQKAKRINEILKKLINYAKQSVMVVSPVYICENGKPTDFTSGIRYLYPTRFHEFDFTYQEYTDEVNEKNGKYIIFIRRMISNHLYLLIRFHIQKMLF